MVILERHLDAGYLTVLLKLLKQLPMSPALPKAFHEDGAARLELPCLPVIWESAAYLPIDLWEPDLLDEFSSYKSITTYTYPCKHLRTCKRHS